MRSQSSPSQIASFTGYQTDILWADQHFIFSLQPSGKPDFENLCRLVKDNHHQLRQLFAEWGGIYFKGFQLSAEQFREIMNLISPSNTLDYVGGIAPRAQFSEGLALSTAMPPQSTIQQHHEQAYQTTWPMKIAFFCDLAPKRGGETPLTSTRHFMSVLPEKVKEQFYKRGVRNIVRYKAIKNVFPSWEEAFKTSKKEDVEAYARKMGMQISWKDYGLETFLNTQGLAKHPETKELLWHNHAHLFWTSHDPAVIAPNIKMLGPGVADQLAAFMRNTPIDQFPSDVQYGDGGTIDAGTVDLINNLLEEHKRAFKWEKGDFVVLDNMLAFHGRNPFEGDRRILAVLKEEYRSPHLRLV